MLSIGGWKTSKAVFSYFEEHVGRDYYTGDEAAALHAEFLGSGRDRLQVAEAFDRETFFRLIDGQHPGTGEALTNAEKVTAGERRGGLDFTFSPAKSVSVAGLVDGDSRVVSAHREAVRDAVSELEKFLGYRVTNEHGEREFRFGGEFVAAAIEHEFSRELDPQLHSHVVFANLVHAEGAWRTIESHEAFQRDARQYVEQVYESALAGRLAEVGYAVEKDPKGRTHLAEVPQEVQAAFSKRSQQIEAEIAARLARGEVVDRQTAVLATRQAKEGVPDRETHREGVWAAEARAAGYEPGQTLRSVLAAPPGSRAPDDREGAASEALKFAREHLSERQAVFSRAELLTEALRAAPPGVGLADVRAAADKAAFRGDLVARSAILEESPHGDYTSREALRTERELLRSARAGRGAHRSILDPDRAVRAVAAARVGEDRLRPEQADAVRRLLVNRDRHVLIEGVAGAGKSHSLAAFRELAAAEGYHVRGFGPSHRAADELGEKLGTPTSTIDALERTLRQQPPGEKPEIWIVDEAAMASNRHAAQLVGEADRIGARLVFVGDRRQMAAVEAGRPFDLLDRHGRVERIDLAENLRSREATHKAVVDLLAARKAAAAVDRLDQAGRLEVVSGYAERAEAAARAYLAAGGPDRAVLVVDVHRDREALNGVVRRQLRDAGELGREELAFRAARGADRSAPELRRADRFEVGELVQVHGKRTATALGVERGDVGRVVAIDRAAGKIGLELEDGRRVDFEPRKVRGLSILQEAERRVAAGDRLVALEHGSGYKKGDQFRVEKLAGDEIRLRRLDSRGRDVAGERAAVTLRAGERAGLDHGYANIVERLQGLTADRAIAFHNSANAKSRRSHANIYTALSRARDEARAFTDDREAFRRDAARLAEKALAVEPARSRQAPARTDSPPRPGARHGRTAVPDPRRERADAPASRGPSPPRLERPRAQRLGPGVDRPEGDRARRDRPVAARLRERLARRPGRELGAPRLRRSQPLLRTLPRARAAVAGMTDAIHTRAAALAERVARSPVARASLREDRRVEAHAAAEKIRRGQRTPEQRLERDAQRLERLGGRRQAATRQFNDAKEQLLRADRAGARGLYVAAEKAAQVPAGARRLEAIGKLREAYGAAAEKLARGYGHAQHALARVRTAIAATETRFLNTLNALTNFRSPTQAARAGAQLAVNALPPKLRVPVEIARKASTVVARAIADARGIERGR